MNEKLIKKFGKPKFKDGDTVFSLMVEPHEDPMTVDGDPFHNGFQWMYHFKENAYGIGQSYLKGTKFEPKEETFTKDDLMKAFNDGRLYEAGEMELDSDGRLTTFEVWFENQNITS